MATAEWNHGEHGYYMRLRSGSAEIVLQGRMPCIGIEISFDNVADSVPAMKGDGTGCLQRPVIVNLVITLNEGTVMCTYRCDNNGITTYRGHCKAYLIGQDETQLRTPIAAGLTATPGAAACGVYRCGS